VGLIAIILYFSLIFQKKKNRMGEQGKAKEGGIKRPFAHDIYNFIV
jgi:hypothetical protein